MANSPDTQSKATHDPVRDLVTLEDQHAAHGAPASGGSQDSLVNAAAVFEQQLEQMTTWKHQLASQMEVLRRDGIKILERQKMLAIEKKRLADERTALETDRNKCQSQLTQIEQDRKTLEERAAEVSRARTELDELQTQKSKWLAELATAQKAAAETAAQREQAAADLAKAEVKLAAFKELESQAAALESQVDAARGALTTLQTQAAEIEKSQRALTLRAAELAAAENGLKDREAKNLADDVKIRATIEQVEAERRQLGDAQRQLSQERAALAEAGAAAETKLAEAKLQLSRDRAAAEEQIAETTRAMETINEQRTRQEQRWSALEARAAELTAQEEAAGRKLSELAQREESLQGQKRELETAQAALAEKQQQLAAGENALTTRRAEIETELSRNTATTASLQKQLDDERASLSKARSEMQKRLEQAEHEHAEQLDILSKQTKRLSERRAELEGATSDLQKEIEQRVARASETLKEELTKQQAAYEQKLATLTEKTRQTDTDTAAWKSREEELLNKSTAAEAAAEAMRANLSRVQSELEDAGRQRTDLTRELSEQVKRYEREASEWKAKLDAATAEGRSSESQQAAAAVTQSELAALKAQLSEITAARLDVEQRLAEAARSHTREIDQLRSEADKLIAAGRAEAEERASALLLEIGELKKKAKQGAKTGGEVAELQAKLTAAEANLAQALADWDAQTAEWKAKYDALAEDLKHAQATVPSASEINAGITGNHEELNALTKQLRMMESQRNELATQLFAAQDMLQRQNDEKLLNNSALEARMLDQQRAIEKLEAEKSRWNKQLKTVAAQDAPAADSFQAAAHRERLLRQARNLRVYRRQVRETRDALEGHRAEVAHQRDQMRMRKENLEQVKRLLEKQEMVMARKLADHNALKTVAAVGIFVIMVLGSVFVSVYKFVSPVYRSEAVVQVAAPQELQGAELQAWIKKQAEFVHNNEVTYAAWKILRGPDDRYAMHDVREEWLASLSKQLSIQLDSQSRTLAIQYSGPDAQGVSQVCNALAIALTNPAFRESTEQTRTIGASDTILAKATQPLYPTQDNRLMLGLSVVAAVLFVSLIFVILFRHYVSRQLKEIDQMADEQDLAEIKSDLPPEAGTA